MDTDRDEDEIGGYDDCGEPDDFAASHDATVYWRRRFVILAGGIVALGLCAWLLPAGHLGQARTSASARSSAAPLAGEPRCAPVSIVLSLFTSQSGYTPGEQPSFGVYAVSTSTAACALAYGPGSVQVVVTRHGRVVWNSSACPSAAARPVKFTLGVPRVLTLSWNRQAVNRSGNQSGCAGSLSPGASGTFDVMAMTDGQSSPVRTFKLSK